MKLPSTASMAGASARHPWRAIGAWLLVVLIAVSAMGVLGDYTTTEMNFTNEPESQAGLNVLEDAGLVDDNPTDETIIVQSESGTVDDPAFQQRVEEITATLRSMNGIVVPDSVVNYYELSNNPETEEAAGGLVSQDRATMLIPLTLTGTQDEAAENAATYIDTVDAMSGDGIRVLSVGFISIGEENNTIAEEDLVKGEAFGIIAAVVILVVVFGALIAAGLPILLSVVSIIVSFGIATAIGQIWELSFFVSNMITMIGLAVGIDYTLFVVERYREERRHGRARRDAITIAGGTASKAVSFSGGTVILALLGMFLIPSSIFRALAIGATSVVAVAVIASLTLVPALLSLLGDRIDWPRRRNYDEIAYAHHYEDSSRAEAMQRGFWARMTHMVMARPIIGAVLTIAILLSAAIPYLDINTGFSGVETLPEDSEVRQGFEILDDEFSAGRLSPVQVAVTGDKADVEAAIDRFRADVADDTVANGDGTEPAFLPVPSQGWAQWNDEGTVALLQMTMTVPSNDDRAYEIVKHLRDDAVPAAFGDTGATVYVTGDSAFSLDFIELVDTYTPIVLSFVLVLSFLLLLLAFRSIVVSATAIVMNLLSVGAAYGLLVLVFQKSVGQELFGFQHTPTIEAWIPIFLFCVLFGLSMDYQVFLLSRIREHYDESGRNRESVAVGLQSTARIITGAALIMVAVFSGFAAGRLVMLQQMGFGLGVAILLDATLVRSILVPSVMALLGDRNWYLPAWLRWLPDLRVEGAPTPAPREGGMAGIGARIDAPVGE